MEFPMVAVVVEVARRELSGPAMWEAQELG